MEHLSQHFNQFSSNLSVSKYTNKDVNEYIVSTKNKYEIKHNYELYILLFCYISYISIQTYLL